LLAIVMLVWSMISFAQEHSGSTQPYIDQLKRGLEPSGDSIEAPTDSLSPHIDAVKQRLKPQPQNVDGSYIESLRSTLPPEQAAKEDGNTSSFVEQEKARLEPEQEGGAIQAVQDGRSELKPGIKGEIHHAAGIRIGVSGRHNITASTNSSTRAFGDVYGDSTELPEFYLFYEFQPFHSEWLGNIGVVFAAGLSYFKGKGAFALNLVNPRTGQSFGTSSRAEFRFFAIPASLGLNYRFNLARFLRPYVQVLPTLTGYYEGRNDKNSPNRGTSRGVTVSAGINVLLNPLFRRASWEVYRDYGFKHYYLTFDYSRLSSISGDVRFSSSGASAGLTYEF
jgi:hypothetical protein